MLNFFLQGMGDCELVGVKLRLKKSQMKKNNGVKSDQYNGQLHDQEMTDAVIDLFLVRYDLWHSLIGSTYHAHARISIQTQLVQISNLA